MCGLHITYLLPMTAAKHPEESDLQEKVYLEVAAPEAVVTASIVGKQRGER